LDRHPVDGVDDTLFPFESRFIDIDGHRIHYVDEGTGHTLLFLHGNPTWSFDYSTVIASLCSEFRCIAVDYPGFGLSVPAAGYRYLPAEHAQVISGFVDVLTLEGITLVAHDWGGPIGLATVQQRGEVFDRLVLTNTWAWPVGAPLIQVMSHVMGSRIGRLLIRQLNLFVNVMIPVGHRLTKPTSKQMAHYQQALDSPARREASAVFPREITASRAFLGDIEAGLPDIAALPTLIIWGDADFLRKCRIAPVGTDFPRPPDRRHRRCRPLRPIGRARAIRGRDPRMAHTIGVITKAP